MGSVREGVGGVGVYFEMSAEPFAMPIIKECFTKYREGATSIQFPLCRLAEFVMAGASGRYISKEEYELFRQACLKGEARAFGIPVTFNSRM